MSLKKLITYTEEVGPDICEFEIVSDVLCKIVKEFIKEYKDDFDAEDGRMLRVSKNKISGLAPIDIYPEKKTDIIECLTEVLTEIDIDDDYIEEIRSHAGEIIDDASSVRWLALTRDLSALDLDCGVDLIDDEIVRKINDAIGKSLDRGSAMKDEAFRNRAVEYLGDELQYLMLISEYNQEKNVCVRTIKSA